MPIRPGKKKFGGKIPQIQPRSEDLGPKDASQSGKFDTHLFSPIAISIVEFENFFLKRISPGLIPINIHSYF